MKRRPMARTPGRIAILLLAACTVPASFSETVYEVPLMRAASYPNQQGFVRVSSTGEAGEVEIHAWDDTGMYAPNVAKLMLPAGATIPFNSLHLEQGRKELDEGREGEGPWPGIGTGTGDWHLQLRGDIDFRVGVYQRTDDGFLTAMGSSLLAYPPEVVGLETEGCVFEANIFNPASNREQESLLRLINYDLAAAEVEIIGIDEEGSRRGPVTFAIPPGEVRTLTSRQLEEGDDEMTGSFGDGVGKWQLYIVSENPLSVMNLLESKTGHLTNLGPAAMPGYSDAAVPLDDVGCESAPPFILSRDK